MAAKRKPATRLKKSKLDNLCRHRNGTYYARVKVNGKSRERSLKTRDDDPAATPTPSPGRTPPLHSPPRSIGPSPWTAGRRAFKDWRVPKSWRTCRWVRSRATRGSRRSARRRRPFRTAGNANRAQHAPRPTQRVHVPERAGGGRSLIPACFLKMGLLATGPFVTWRGVRASPLGRQSLRGERSQGRR